MSYSISELPWAILWVYVSVVILHELWCGYIHLLWACMSYGVGIYICCELAWAMMWVYTSVVSLHELWCGCICCELAWAHYIYMYIELWHYMSLHELFVWVSLHELQCEWACMSYNNTSHYSSCKLTHTIAHASSLTLYIAQQAHSHCV